MTTIASNGKSRRPSKSKHFWWRSRFLIKLTISVPSATLSVKIFVSSLLHNKLKFTRKSGHAKKKWSTFSVSFLQMKQESPLLPVSHGTPAFRPKLGRFYLIFEREIQIWPKVLVKKSNHAMYQDENPHRCLQN